MKPLMTSLTLLGGIAAAATAQPTLNGTAVGDEAFYGAALSTQNTRTGFGDGSGNPDVIVTGNNLGDAGGSEIDQVFGTVSNGRLYVLITGNLEGNFNKLNLFIDSGPVGGVPTDVGVNQLDGANLPTGLDGFCCGVSNPADPNPPADGALQKMSGLTFDTNFTADYAMVFSHGRETLNSGQPDQVEFWAVNAHFADLTQGSAGEVGALGMQLAPRGEPRVLRSPAIGEQPGDYNDDNVVDAADYTVWRDALGAEIELANDPIGGTIGAAQYTQWRENFGAEGDLPGGNIDEFAFVPFGNPGNTEDLLSDFTLPGLSQGELIDRTYALGAGGCTDDTGAGCMAPELEFALAVDPNELADNASSHRDFDNFVDLELAFDNSNTAGVQGNDFTANPNGGGVTGDDNPQDVVTGLEFSIPLAEIGNPTGDIKIAAFVNNNSFEFVANQFAGDGLFTDIDQGNFFLTNANNLGGQLYGPVGPGEDPPPVTLDGVAGDQFVTITQTPPLASGQTSAPEPTSAALLLLGGLLAGGRRR
ncbi:MAG: PEP-CTERM sorting domain-containing protein [Planctomycetota bacterium]